MNCKICHSRRSRFFCRKDSFSYFYCPICQTLFLHPQPTTKIINDYYEKNFRFAAGFTNQPRTILRAQIVIKKLKVLNPTGKTLLDIGSGLGFFRQEAEKNNLKTTGIEPSKFLRDVSINRLIDTQPLGFDSYFKKNKKKRFDFITLNHVIEHLPNPKRTIHRVGQMLNKNGVLYIETPNLDSHLFRSEKENYIFLTPPEHLWLLSLESFKKIIKEQEYKIIHTSTYSYPEHFMGIVKKILSKKNKKILQKISLLHPGDGENGNKTNWKYILFDRLLAPLLTPLLNLNQYGSILELYIRKK